MNMPTSAKSIRLIEYSVSMTRKGAGQLESLAKCITNNNHVLINLICVSLCKFVVRSQVPIVHSGIVIIIIIYISSHE